MTHIRLHNTTIPTLCQLLNYSAVILERGSGFSDRDGSVETVSCGFDDAHGVGVCKGFVADVVRFVDVAMEAAVVEGYVYVYDVAVFEDALVRDAVADAFVYACADGFGEVAVVEGGGVGLENGKS